jgi:tetratricopeptide (TPR) repeat protein
MQFDELQKEFERIRTCLRSATAKYDGRDYQGACGDFEECLELLEKGHPDDHPDRITCLEGLANTYFVLHRYVEARQIFKILLKLSESHPDRKMDSLVITFKLAKCAERGGNTQEALSLYQKLVETLKSTVNEGNPLQSSVLESYSALLSRSGIDSKKAKQLAEQARINRQKYNEKGGVSDKVLRGMGRELEVDYMSEPTVDNLAAFSSDAISSSRFREVVSMRPHFALTARQLSLSLTCLVVGAAAACGFLFIKHTVDQRLPASHFLSEAKSKAAAGNWQDTIYAADQALEADKDNLQARWYRAVALGKMGDYEKAVLDFNILADLAPNNAKVLVGRAGMYMFLGKTDQAIDDCNQAIRLDPKEPRAYDFRGAAYLRQLKFKEANADCSQANQLKCQNEDPFANPTLPVTLAKTSR